MAATVRGVTGSVIQAASIAIAETDGSPQAGDYRYLFLNYGSASAPVTLPSGWTSLVNATVGSGELVVAYKPWAAGVGTETVSVASSSNIGHEVVAVTAMDTAATPTVITNGSATASTAVSTAALTPTTADGLLLGYFALTVSSGATTATLSNPTGTTSLDTHPGAASASYVIRMSSVAITSTAAAGPYTATGSTSGTYRTAALFVPTATASHAGQFFPFLRL